MSHTRTFIPGTEQKRPRNVGQYDMIRCTKVIAQVGPNLIIRCDAPMQVMKLVDSGLEIKRGQVKCNAWNGHNIQTKQMYIAFCPDKHRHNDGNINVVCCVCIENYGVWSSWRKPTFEIERDVYCYSPKKKKYGK